MRSRTVMRLSTPSSVIVAATRPAPDSSLMITEIGDAALVMPVTVPRAYDIYRGGLERPGRAPQS